eukprot:1497784-Lingulodinium_polyedra.AAC.1
MGSSGLRVEALGSAGRHPEHVCPEPVRRDHPSVEELRPTPEAPEGGRAFCTPARPGPALLPGAPLAAQPRRG